MSTGGSVAVVTDSTSSLSAEVTERHGVAVVPLRVDAGSVRGVDGRDVTTDDVAAALSKREKVTTSRPAPADFVEAYARALDAGASHVVSVHLSSRLSGTWDSARLAALEFSPGVVRVVDSRSTGMGLGFAVVAAAEAAEAGSTPPEVEAAAVAVVEATTSLLYVDSLEHLWRGGRIGAAARLFGTGLSIKPLLQVRDGQIEPLEKVRTSAKALTRLVQLAVQAADGASVDVAVQHVAAPDAAEGLATKLRDLLPDLRTLQQSELGAVVGAHLGPGTLGVVVVRR